MTPEDPWTDEDELLMHLINEHGLGQWQVHGDPTLMHNAAHAMPGLCDHPIEMVQGPTMPKVSTVVEMPEWANPIPAEGDDLEVTLGDGTLMRGRVVKVAPLEDQTGYEVTVEWGQ